MALRTTSQQVISNLLSNAIKFTPSGGQVSIDLRRVNSHVELKVSDTGKGIEPSFLPHVFDRFRQADGSMTRAHGGLGLGFVIVRELVNLHSGIVEARSDGPNKGATFVVKLPLMAILLDSQQGSLPVRAMARSPSTFLPNWRGFVSWSLTTIPIR